MIITVVTEKIIIKMTNMIMMILNNILIQDIYAHQKLCTDCWNVYYMKHHILENV